MKRNFNDDDDLAVGINFKFVSNIISTDETSEGNFIVRYTGEILRVSETGRKMNVGEFLLYHVFHGATMNAKIDVGYLLSIHNDDLSRYMCLFDEGGWSDAVFDQFGPIQEWDLLIVDGIFIKPKYRRKGYASEVVETLRDRVFSSCGLIVGQALPWDSDLNPENGTEWREAKLRARMFLGKMNFHEIGETGIYGYAPSLRKQPVVRRWEM